MKVVPVPCLLTETHVLPDAAAGTIDPSVYLVQNLVLVYPDDAAVAGLRAVAQTQSNLLLLLRRAEFYIGRRPRRLRVSISPILFVDCGISRACLCVERENFRTHTCGTDKQEIYKQEPAELAGGRGYQLTPQLRGAQGGSH